MNTDAPTPLDLDAIVAAIAECRTYNFGMYQADRLAHEHAPALVEEVKRLRAEVARPAPAWDEDSVQAEVLGIDARHHFHGTACLCGFDSHGRARSATEHITSAVLAVVRRHLPVKPDRGTVARVIFEAGAAGAAIEFGLDGPVPWSSLDADDVERMCTQADAVLDLWPGESRAAAQAEALRDAADAVTEIDGRRDDAAAAWLRARAARLAAEGGHVHRLVRADDAEAKVERQRDRLRARERQVRRLRAEVTRLHALVADLRATASPAWDEYAAVEGMVRAVYPSLFTDDRQPLRVFGEAHSDAELREGERDVARERMRQALAVVREHLPVKPSREDVYRAWHGTEDPWGGCADSASIERVLDLLPGRSEAEVKAEALRDFAARVRDEMDDSDKVLGTKWATDEYRHGMRSALIQVDEEADRLAAEGGADRE